MPVDRYRSEKNLTGYNYGFSAPVTLSHQCFSDISVGAFSVSVLRWRWGHRCALSVSVGDKGVSALSIYTDTAHP
jgi:hypothetical protein